VELFNILECGTVELGLYDIDYIQDFIVSTSADVRVQMLSQQVSDQVKVIVSELSIFFEILLGLDDELADYYLVAFLVLDLYQIHRTLTGHRINIPAALLVSFGASHTVRRNELEVVAE
jgi:hypothetical protein